MGAAAVTRLSSDAATKHNPPLGNACHKKILSIIFRLFKNKVYTPNRIHKCSPDNNSVTENQGRKSSIPPNRLYGRLSPCPRGGMTSTHHPG